jgi:hypothetical protein
MLSRQFASLGPARAIRVLRALIAPTPTARSDGATTPPGHGHGLVVAGCGTTERSGRAPGAARPAMIQAARKARTRAALPAAGGMPSTGPPAGAGDCGTAVGVGGGGNWASPSRPPGGASWLPMDRRARCSRQPTPKRKRPADGEPRAGRCWTGCPLTQSRHASGRGVGCMTGFGALTTHP